MRVEGVWPFDKVPNADVFVGIAVTMPTVLVIAVSVGVII